MTEERGEAWRAREIRDWEKGNKKIDLTKEFKENNKELLENYGRDNFTYKAELTDHAHIFWNKNEARFAHGYPATAWIQLGLLYGAGLYTAKEQGCVARGVIFSRFWRFHYFDWLTFLRRGGVYAWGGGLVAGTVLFGSPDVSIKRCISLYNHWMAENIQDKRGDYAGYLPSKF